MGANTIGITKMEIVPTHKNHKPQIPSLYNIFVINCPCSRDPYNKNKDREGKNQFFFFWTVKIGIFFF